jgi:hypothetical protein
LSKFGSKDKNDKTWENQAGFLGKNTLENPLLSIDKGENIEKI